jgi:polar amino acid transport system permease protein
MLDWFSYFLRILPDLWKGTLVSLEITIIGLVIGFGMGLLSSLLRIYGGCWIRWLALGYIELFRGTPLLVQLFVTYYGLPEFNIVLSPMLTAYLVLGLNSGAYQSEYFRGAIQAIGSGQMMAARAIGLTRAQAVVNIILPQALRMMIPAWSNEPIALIKASAVAYLITVKDLMKRAITIVARNFDVIGTYIAVAVIYLIIVMIFTYCLSALEKRMQIPGLSMESQRSH